MKHPSGLVLALLACGLVVALAGCRPAVEPGPVTVTATSTSTSTSTSGSFPRDGLERSYTVHLPTGHPVDRPLPLLLALHGGGGSAAQFAAASGLDRVADQRGFIVVYGQGTAWGRATLAVWNAGDCCGQAADGAQSVDDVGYAREVVRRVSTDFAVDPARVYVTGMSNGAMLAERLACEAADVFAGAASVSGALQVGTCAPSRPIPVLLIHGTQDEAIPYDGGRGSGLGQVSAIPTERDLAGWAERNGCRGAVATQPVPALPDANGRTVDRLSYPGCRAPAVLYRIRGGVHEWPGGRIDGPRATAEATTALDASAAVADFFGL